ncbi:MULTISPECIES: histidine phosphatase family protein [unclassified Paenibacillus]|uniref:histidine phosphatase family protein n=1 Tax=unclassified Paenibacillus TaxID=185978 RepID=UPI002F40D22D
MRLYIIRHADPDYERDTITAAGHLEAQALSRRLQRMGIDEIYSSPVPRALYTMQYTSELMQIAPSIQPWMAELDWRVTDKSGVKRSIWNTDGEWIRGQRPLPNEDNWHQFEAFQEDNFLSKYINLQGESDKFMASLGYFREDGVYRMVKPNKKQVAVFCHLGFGITWLSHLLELPLPRLWAGFSMAPSSVTTILLDERSEEFAVPRCLSWGDTSHLYEVGLPISKQGIVANTD